MRSCFSKTGRVFAFGFGFIRIVLLTHDTSSHLVLKSGVEKRFRKLVTQLSKLRSYTTELVYTLHFVRDFIVFFVLHDLTEKLFF